MILGPCRGASTAVFRWFFEAVVRNKEEEENQFEPVPEEKEGV